MSVPLRAILKIMTAAGLTAGFTIGPTAGPAIAAAQAIQRPGHGHSGGLAVPLIPGSLISDSLSSVAVISRADAWAVGISLNSGGNEQTLIEHWNGRTWSIVPSPDPAGPGANNELDSVAATSASNAWAVGQFWNGTNWQSLILHWNGRSWKRVHSPDPGGATQRNILNGVSATSSAAWIVGYYSLRSGGTQTLILRWNGSSWRRVASPQPGGSFGGGLRAVAAVSSTSAWAVGEFSTRSSSRTLVVHWNGRSWRQIGSPSVGGTTRINKLLGVSAPSRSTAWAVGEWSPAVLSSRTLAERWNGASWHVVPSPSPGTPGGFTTLSAVAAASSAQAWAVGSYPKAGAFEPLLEHWNGAAWRQVAIPALPADATGGQLAGIAMAPRGRAWAVGDCFTGIGAFTLILDWNGRSWQQIPSPNR